MAVGWPTRRTNLAFRKFMWFLSGQRLTEFRLSPVADGNCQTAAVYSRCGGADGKELFFTNSSYNTLMSVHLNMTVDHFENDKPQLLFDLDAHAPTRFYVVSRDGQRIYMATYGAGSTAPITVTTNWMNLLKK